MGVHHILGHISANFIEHKDLEPPFTALVISGGHTYIAEMESYTSCRILGSTRDDAAGEAYDKVARVLGLGYPGGPLIDKIAKEGNPEAVHFKRVFLEKDSFDFSFSGIKTGVLNYVNTEKHIIPLSPIISMRSSLAESCATKHQDPLPTNPLSNLKQALMVSSA